MPPPILLTFSTPFPSNSLNSASVPSFHPTWNSTSPTQYLQALKLQHPISYQGITNNCCHSVGPSCMVVLRILLITHYNFYYQQGIGQQFSSNPLLQMSMISLLCQDIPSSMIPFQIPRTTFPGPSKPPFCW